MLCPICGKKTRVAETRSADDGAATRRRRVCEGYGERFTTVERIEVGALYVRKRDGSRERFDREKLLGGLLRAAHKRPVDHAALEGLADEITGEVAAAGGELDAALIGESALAGLRALDRVAYLQFAAVYKSFTDASEFSAELAEIDRPEADEDLIGTVGSVRPKSNPA